ncbi:hypothetical protein HDU92_001471 [Lobulomyces angularis]|nr:hypothetical protein HDU92_001471 [Lobulomyces angularis]
MSAFESSLQTFNFHEDGAKHQNRFSTKLEEIHQKKTKNKTKIQKKQQLQEPNKIPSHNLRLTQQQEFKTSLQGFNGYFLKNTLKTYCSKIDSLKTYYKNFFNATCQNQDVIFTTLFRERLKFLNEKNFKTDQLLELGFVSFQKHQSKLTEIFNEDEKIEKEISNLIKNYENDMQKLYENFNLEKAALETNKQKQISNFLKAINITGKDETDVGYLKRTIMGLL